MALNSYFRFLWKKQKRFHKETKRLWCFSSQCPRACADSAEQENSNNTQNTTHCVSFSLVPTHTSGSRTACTAHIIHFSRERNLNPPLFLYTTLLIYNVKCLSVFSFMNNKLLIGNWTWLFLESILIFNSILIYLISSINNVNEF